MSADALAFHLPFDGSGTTAVDRAGDNDARVEGASRADGRVGRALALVGDGYAVVDHDDALATEAGTLSMHVKLNDTGNAGFVSKDAAGTADPGHLTLGVRGGEIWARIQEPDESYVLRGPTPATDSWHHVVFSFGGEGATLFVDGEAVDSADTTVGLDANPNPLVVGANAWSSADGAADDLTWYTDGLIDDVRLYDEQLTPTDVPVPVEDGRDGRYGGYAQPAAGTADWHRPLNRNFAKIQTDLESLADRVADLGADRPDVSDYAQPDRGTEDWHEPLNENFEAIGSDLEAIARRVEELE
jgi:hypothetical protein